MQVFDRDVFWPVVAGTAGLLILAVGFIVAIVVSHQKLLKLRLEKSIQLRALEQKYRDLFDNSLVRMVRVSLHDWNILEANEAFKKLAAKIPLRMGDNLLAYLEPAEQEKIKAELYGKGSLEQYEFHVRCSDGTI